ncbi:MAG TPA: glycosyltransferase family 4 protein [Firmicutes bacterium]|nr:glycosyltransferase family 4 protein [Bacillota bacterium]HHT42148.1 glycosyltransferase family 4 protein [Bacillota bacterium]
MKILMLSWEYPPKVIGGLARAVADLSQAMARVGHEVAVVTSDAPECEPSEYVSGVRVYRVNQFFPRPMDFLEEVHFQNYHLVQKGSELLSQGDFDLIHAHDWLVAPSAKVLKHAFGKPLVCTIHATEWGRNNGLHNDLQRHISDLEWWLTYESYRVICCSESMRSELRSIFQVPEDKLTVIPNGVHPDNFVNVHPDLDKWRRNWAAPEEEIVLYVGRHVYEKGVDILLSAAPKVLAHRPQAKFVIAGMGPCHDELKGQAWHMGLGEKVLFAGFVDDLTRNSLYHLADAAVFPSRYEPFGIVALEAMAGQAPVIVSDVGGFAETVQHEVNGLTFYAGNANSLADNIIRMLTDKALARRLSERASRDLVEKFDWKQIAHKTVASYQETMPKRDDHVFYDRYQLTADALQKGGSFRESSNHGRR